MTSSTRIFNSRPLDIPEPALKEIIQAGFDSHPNETGGLLFPNLISRKGKLTWIAILDNIAVEPTTMMEFNRDQFIAAGLEYVQTEVDWELLTIWHTHPSGGVGPSRKDMQKRIPQMGNLVIALKLNDRTGIPTWY